MRAFPFITKANEGSRTDFSQWFEDQPSCIQKFQMPFVTSEITF